MMTGGRAPSVMKWRHPLPALLLLEESLSLLDSLLIHPPIGRGTLSIKSIKYAVVDPPSMIA